MSNRCVCAPFFATWKVAQVEHDGTDPAVIFCWNGLTHGSTIDPEEYTFAAFPTAQRYAQVLRAEYRMRRWGRTPNTLKQEACIVPIPGAGIDGDVAMLEHSANSVVSEIS